MSNTLADQYHDEHGRPIAQAVPPRSPRVVAPRTLEPWQIALRDRAAAKQESRAAAKELGPLHNRLSCGKAERRETLRKSLSTTRPAAAASDAAALAAIDQAFTYPAPVVPPPAIASADKPTYRTATGDPDWAAISARHHERLAELHNETRAAADRTAAAAPQTEPDPDPQPAADQPIRGEELHTRAARARERIAARAANPPPEPPACAAAAARRRAGALKAAATVRARRAKAELDADVNQRMAKAIDRAQERYHRQENLAARAAAEPPGTPQVDQLIDLARRANAEAWLFRTAHISRYGSRPSQWSIDQRIALAESLAKHLQTQKSRAAKGTAK